MPTYSPLEPQQVEAYSNSFSVWTGQSIEFSVSVKDVLSDPLLLEIYRSDQIVVDNSTYGERADYSYKQDFRKFLTVRPGASPYFTTPLKPQTFPSPANASQEGCAWPSVISWSIPLELRSGVYFARFTQDAYSTYVIFVVRSSKKTAPSRIVCQLSVNTYQAYNPFGGYCLYGEPISKDIKNPISFERPCQLWDYILFEASIFSWFDRNFAVDFCTNRDLDSDPASLSDYDLFVSCGHDEYWSSRMRRNIEEFGRLGGNVLFLSGNTCYRPVSFQGNRYSQMYRITLESGDYGKPEALTTGVNWTAGRWTKPLVKRGYVVRQANHWVFEATGLKEGDTFGDTEGIIGYEADCAVYNFEGHPAPPTPSDFLTLATADLPDWNDWYGRTATMGMFRREGNGVVMTAATTGWGRGLLTDTGVVHQITDNIVRKLQIRCHTPFGEETIT